MSKRPYEVEIDFPENIQKEVGKILELPGVKLTLKGHDGPAGGGFFVDIDWDYSQHDTDKRFSSIIKQGHEQLAEILNVKFKSGFKFTADDVVEVLHQVGNLNWRPDNSASTSEVYDVTQHFDQSIGQIRISRYADTGAYMYEGPNGLDGYGTFEDLGNAVVNAFKEAAKSGAEIVAIATNSNYGRRSQDVFIGQVQISSGIRSINVASQFYDMARGYAAGALKYQNIAAVPGVEINGAAGTNLTPGIEHNL